MAAAPLPRAIDVPRSEARFSVAHIWVDHVSGTIPIVSGTVALPPGSLIPTSATAVLDAAAVAAPPVQLDYLVLADPDSFAEVGPGHRGAALLLVAARVGSTRLIDNVSLDIGGRE